MRITLASALAALLPALATAQPPAEPALEARTLRGLEPLVVEVARLGRDVEPGAIDRIMVTMAPVVFAEGEPREVELRLPPAWDR